jgi:hypothetical protein
MFSDFEQIFLLRIPPNQGIVARIPGNRRSFYEVRYKPSCFLAFFSLS